MHSEARPPERQNRWSCGAQAASVEEGKEGVRAQGRSLPRRECQWRGFVWDPLLTQDPQKQSQAESPLRPFQGGSGPRPGALGAARPISLQGQGLGSFPALHNGTPPSSHVTPTEKSIRLPTQEGSSSCLPAPTTSGLILPLSSHLDLQEFK